MDGVETGAAYVASLLDGSAAGSGLLALQPILPERRRPSSTDQMALCAAEVWRREDFVARKKEELV